MMHTNNVNWILTNDEMEKNDRTNRQAILVIRCPRAQFWGLHRFRMRTADPRVLLRINVLRAPIINKIPCRVAPFENQKTLGIPIHVEHLVVRTHNWNAEANRTQGLAHVDCTCTCAVCMLYTCLCVCLWWRIPCYTAFACVWIWYLRTWDSCSA